MLIITNQSLVWLDKKKKYLKRKDKITDLLGVTKSLLRDSQNFVFHYSTRPDEEFSCEQ